MKAKRAGAELHAAFSNMVAEIVEALGVDRTVKILRHSATLIELEVVKDAIKRGGLNDVLLAAAGLSDDKGDRS